jgi:hypothetical protein
MLKMKTKMISNSSKNQKYGFKRCREFLVSREITEMTFDKISNGISKIRQHLSPPLIIKEKQKEQRIKFRAEWQAEGGAECIR